MMGAGRSVRGMTLVEVMVALAVLTLMMSSIWSSFRGTIRGLELAGQTQDRYRDIRTGLDRVATELSMAYLSFNRPADEARHYTLFEGRDSFDSDSVTFSSFAHLRIRKHSNESDQSIIQFFLAPDSQDSSRTHLYRRESNRLTGDLPEHMEEYWPAYVLVEDVAKFDLKYWDSTKEEWIDEWATMRADMHPDRLPQRVKIVIGVKESESDMAEFTTQTILFMQEKLDLSR